MGENHMLNPSHGKSRAVNPDIRWEIEFIKRNLDAFSSLESSDNPTMQMIGLLAKDVKRLAELVERMHNDSI